MLQPVIWIISRDHWPRAMLRAELIERGCDAVGYLTIEEALEQLDRRRPDLVVVDLADQQQEIVNRLVKLGVPVIALGSAADFSPPWTGDIPFTAAMRRPFSLGEVADRVQASLRLR